MDFTLPAEVEDHRKRYQAFVAEHLVPLERNPASYDEHENIRLDLLETLRGKAKAAGLWAPQMPKERGGLGFNVVKSEIALDRARDLVRAALIDAEAAIHPFEGQALVAGEVGERGDPRMRRRVRLLLERASVNRVGVRLLPGDGQADGALVGEHPRADAGTQRRIDEAERGRRARLLEGRVHQQE